VSENPQGRVDLLLMRLGEEVCKRVQSKTGIDLWNGSPETNQSGAKQLLEEFIGLSGIPQTPIDVPMTLAQLVLPKRSRIVNNRGGEARKKRKLRRVA
jgi:hypothetical protein